MAKTEWKLSNGVNFADDTEFGVHVRTNTSGNTEIAYLAFGEIAVLELNGKYELNESISEDEVIAFAADEVRSCDMALPVLINGETHIIGVNDIGDVIHPTTEENIIVESSEFLEMDDVTALDEFDLADVIGAIAE